MREINSAIGGYLSLEVTERIDFIKDAIFLQSARACFTLLLERKKTNIVWLPYYICDAVVGVLNELKINISYYSIDARFLPNELPKLGEDDIFIYVNYFGICDEQVDFILNKLPSKSVILDNSQAFYSKNKKCLGVISSPRKFFGVPDGGVLYTSEKLVLPTTQDDESALYLKHLVGRYMSTPEKYYDDYIKAEERIKKSNSPKKISDLTLLLLRTINFRQVKLIRNENFKLLHNALGKINKINIPSNIDGPLCYPFLTDSIHLKEKLIDNKIYVPTYWMDVLNRVSSEFYEHELVSKLIAIPCDQRYSSIEMKKIINLILEEF